MSRNYDLHPWPEEVEALPPKILAATSILVAMLETCRAEAEMHNIGATEALLALIEGKFLQIKNSAGEIAAWQPIRPGRPPKWAENTRRVQELVDLALSATGEMEAEFKPKRLIVIKGYLNGLLSVARRIRELLDEIPCRNRIRRRKREQSEPSHILNLEQMVVRKAGRNGP